MRILLVDDRLDSSAIIADWLGEFFAAVSIESAASGEQALEAIRRSCPDLVLASHRPPAMDGVKLAGVVKARPNPPVVAVVGTGIDGDFEMQCAAAGADFWLEKRHLQARLLAFLQQRFPQDWVEGVIARKKSARPGPATHTGRHRSPGNRRRVAERRDDASINRRNSS